MMSSTIRSMLPLISLYYPPSTSCSPLARQVLFYLLIAVFGMNMSNTATSLLIIKRGQQEHHKSSGRQARVTICAIVFSVHLVINHP